MRPIRFLSIGLILFIVAVPVCAQQITITSLSDNYTLIPNLSLLEDVEGELGLNDVLSPVYQTRFQRPAESVLNFNYSDSTYWLKVELDWSDDVLSGDTNFLLEIGPPKPTNRTRLYFLDAAGQLVDEVPFSLRTEQHHPREVRSLGRGFVARLSPQTDAQVYLQVSSHRNFYLPYSLLVVRSRLSVRRCRRHPDRGKSIE